MAEQGDAGAWGLEVLGEETAADERRDAERVEPRRADHGAADRFTRTVAHPHDKAPTIVRRDALEHVLLRREIDEIGPRDVIRRPQQLGAPDFDESRRVLVRQRPKDNRVDQREHGRAGADADRDRCYRDGGEALVPEQACTA